MELPNKLGFNHLTDELRNALNPESGLPANLLLRPDQLSQMGMEKAVAHVGDINRWRATQKTAADRELANKALLVREYTENNPKGLRWVELKEQAPELGEGWQIKPFPSIDGFEVVDDLGRQRSIGSTEKEALGMLNREERRRALEQQLKYEGDTMGHCVGGYCDDVVVGRSRIFSLRDAKGEPHVTVEVQKNLADDIVEGGMSIVQIKGKQNKAPNPEYLPFVQDFVKNSPLNSPWDDVGDFENTGLVRRGNVFSPTEKQGLIDLGADVPEYLTTEDIRALRKLRGDEGFAEGGLVNSIFGDVTPKAMLNRIIDVYNQL